MGNKLAVIALGGNALLRGTQKGTIEEQTQNTKDTLKNIIFLIKEGYNIIIAHGNGPQVGNILMQNAAGKDMYDLPEMPLDYNVASSQGGIGYMIEHNLRNILKENGIDKNVVTLVTQVIVDKNDPAFQNPVKRVGRTYTKESATKLTAEKGWLFKEEVKIDGGMRRVVPSPTPIDFSNSEIVEDLAKKGNIVITVGGGGIPCYINEEGMAVSVEGVVDKDLASAVVGNKVGADEFFILTDVPYIYKNFKQDDQEILEFLDYTDCEKYIADGTFAEGSMAPKIRACMQFVKNGGEKSIITEATLLEDKKYGSKITMKY